MEKIVRENAFDEKKRERDKGPVVRTLVSTNRG